MFGTAIPIHTSDRYRIEEFVWRRDSAPIKLLHEREGFAVISSIGGGWRGGGEAVSLKLDSDGFWWLDGRSAQDSLFVKALAIRTNRRLTATTFRVTEFGTPRRLIHRSQGICFISGIAGEWGGSGEHAKLSIRDDGYWYFEVGRSNDSASAEATAVLMNENVAG